jgi:putative DNA primase/helicase
MPLVGQGITASVPKHNADARYVTPKDFYVGWAEALRQRHYRPRSNRVAGRTGERRGRDHGKSRHSFGLWPLIDKRVAIIPDARLGSNEASKAIEHLLSVSGEDSLTVDRKYQEHWTGKLTARFLILTNELPRFADAAGALPSRFVVLPLQHSFYGKEELDLKEKLRLELPSILNWALDGLDQLRKRGHFEMPKSAQDAIRQIEDLASPVAAFVREECVVGLNRRIEKAKLYGAWKAYCEEQGEKPGSQRMFGRNLLAAFPRVRAGHSGNTKYYNGISLADDEDGEGANGDEGRPRSASNSRPSSPQRPAESRGVTYYSPGGLEGARYPTIAECSQARERAGNVGVCVVR